MTRKGYYGRSTEHSLNSRGVKTKQHLNIQIWRGKKLTTSYKLLEVLATQGPQFQQLIYNDGLIYWKVGKMALSDTISRLENKDLIKITKEIAPSGRLSYLLTITRKGYNEYKLTHSKVFNKEIQEQN